MKKKNQGIQQFRMIAAAMVIAIHTFPFQNLAPFLDTFITLTLFRVAVPFFFMISGFYVLGPLAKQQSYSSRLKVHRFLKKQSKLYAWIILAYLPLSFYSGILSLNMSFIQWFKLIFFEGTLYHLWYFPAVILGVILVGLLLNYWSIQRVLFLTFGLYLIGLGGDSWSGVVTNLPILKDFYQFLFESFGGTRNGLFFAPLYLTLGAWLATRKQISPRYKLSLLFAFIALLFESYALHQLTEPKHDSMYFFLPLVMVLLFQKIVQWQPKSPLKNTSIIALGIYIIHPYVIALTHFVGKVIPVLQNNLIDFLVVFFLSWGLVHFTSQWKQKCQKKKQTPVSRSTRVISKQAIQQNLQAVQAHLSPETKVMAVVKANAYGCDANLFSKTLEKRGVDFFAVATIDEGINLRKNGISGSILVLGYTSPSRIKELQYYSLIQSIVSEDHGKALNQQKVPIACHLAVDTGMHRLGVTANAQTIKGLYQLSYLKIEGIYSHLGSADSLDPLAIERTENQITTYNQIIQQLKARNIPVGLTHLQSSYGILNYKELAYDYVRPGMLLYGMLSSEQTATKTTLDLKPVLSLQAQLISKKRVAAGEAIGYGTDTTFDTTCEIGVVSIGYGDGLPRNLSQQAFHLTYQDLEIPLIGRVCMDMLLVDLSHCPEIPIEAELTLFHNLPKVADSNQTITNELLSQLSTRTMLQVR
ncbi:membrane-bound serine racemase VanT [Enterococcus sp. LJL98]